MFVAFAAHNVEQVDGSTVEDMVVVVCDLFCGMVDAAKLSAILLSNKDNNTIFFTEHFRFILHKS